MRFRNTGADHRANQPASRGSGASTRQGSGNRSSDNQAESRYRDRRSDRKKRRQCRAYAASDCSADAHTFRGLGPGLGVFEMLPTSLVRHHDVDVITG